MPLLLAEVAERIWILQFLLPSIESVDFLPAHGADGPGHACAGHVPVLLVGGRRVLQGVMNVTELMDEIPQE